LRRTRPVVEAQVGHDRDSTAGTLLLSPAGWATNGPAVFALPCFGPGNRSARPVGLLGKALLHDIVFPIILLGVYLRQVAGCSFRLCQAYVLYCRYRS
jgi:hypothetical protein